METKTDIIFPDGLSFYLPDAKAPDYVKGSIYLNPAKLIPFMEAHKEYMTDKGYLRVQILVSKSTGNWYTKLDTYKPKAVEGNGWDKTPDPEKSYASSASSIPYPEEDFNPADVPF